MEEKFILSCESTVDLPYSYVTGRNIPVLFYNYSVDGENYEDDMMRDPAALPRFYGFLDDGKFPSTSQINEFQYEEFFEEQLKKSNLLHIAFGSGMTPSVQNAVKAAEKLRKKYPDRKITVIDSTCSCSGYGLLVDYAADMRDNGSSMEEIEQWVLDNSKNVHHQFFCTDLKYFRRSGRVSGATATIGTILSICPIMRLDDGGRIIAYDKVRGKANAIRRTVKEMAEHAQNGTKYSGKCYISHSDCLNDAVKTKEEIENTFPNLKGKVIITNIGTIIASHTGRGTVAVYFLGDERKPDKK